ncbi:MAG: L-2-hydroxyglutarate oxidase [Fimbriimonas sp.]|nr:L-2-hydroxyglutarate oxidase [Fimbriimonas sp.]
MRSSNVVFIGGGIVGLSAAFKFSDRFPDKKITLLEKENEICLHQTGRNSGVIHSGIYYKPGSLKAKTCRTGKAQLEAFCEEHGIKYERCGKVIVAVDPSQIERLENIQRRGIDNGIPCELIGKERLNELEPHAAGVKAIHVPETGIVDYVGMCQTLASILRERGNEIVLNAKVLSAKETAGEVVVESTQGAYTTALMVNCAGLHSDRLVKNSGQKPTAKIVPFRGEYFELKPAAEHLCKNLIYPVPDPSFPFLGVHFTRMVLGGVECGPNAVLALAREGYRKTDLSISDLFETLGYSGFRKLATKHLKMGMQEMMRSASKSLFVKSLQELIPEIRSQDIVPAPSGIRAQAVLADGSLVDDFSFIETDRIVHVVNAPSPAATASLAIGDHVVEHLATHVG